MSEPRPRRRRRWPWIVAAALVVVLVPVAILVVPILTHRSAGASGQVAPEGYPSSVEATGDDARTRTLSVEAEDGTAVDLAAVAPGDRVVVTGSGFDGGRGIYVAICVIPAEPTTKPGPCIGGVPEQEQTDAAEGTVQWAPSNWINDDWAWKLFGARSYDSVADGTFTAYLEIGEPIGEGFDCSVEACGIYTRNDHTALNDRVQDIYLPIAFAK
jgi:hypothetical protein